jgi:prepilin-type N-terminal cleavage/methylation domain-containing protein
MTRTGHLRCSRDDGFTVIEVLVALALFAVVSSAVMAVVTDSLGLTRANESRVTAADLGNRVLEAARIADPTVAPVASELVTVNGVQHTVTRGVESVRQAGTAGRCGVSPDRTVAQRLHVGVDWPGRRSGQPPVRLSTLRTVDLNVVAPNTGTLYVVVEDADGASVSGVAVTLSPTGATATSDTNGCAVFAAVEPRTDYVVTLEKAGYADPQGVVKPSRGPLGVTRGGITEELFVYSPYAPETAPGGFTVTQTCGADPPPAYRGASSTAAVSDNDTSITVSKPSSTVAGDVMVAQVAIAGGPDPSTITPPSGWTTLAIVRSAGYVTQGVYYRRATSAEANTYTWSYSKAKSVAGITSYSGVHRVDPVNVHAAQAGSSASTSVTAPSVTTTRDNVRLVGFYAASGGGSFTPPSGTTERYDIATGSNSSATHVSASVAGQDFLTAGSTGTRTATFSLSSYGIGHLVALAPTRTPGAALSWTATSWPAAEGYYLRRTVGGLLQRDWTVPGRTTTSSTDGPLVNGTSYVFELSAYAGSSQTDPLSATLTPAC